MKQMPICTYFQESFSFKSSDKAWKLHRFYVFPGTYPYLLIRARSKRETKKKTTYKTKKREENRITIIKFCQSLSYLDACSTHTDDETTLNTRIWLFFLLTSKYFGMEAVLCVILYRCHCSISLFYRFGALVSATHRDMMYFHISFGEKHPHTIYPYQFTRNK